MLVYAIDITKHDPVLFSHALKLLALLTILPIGP